MIRRALPLLSMALPATGLLLASAGQPTTGPTTAPAGELPPEQLDRARRPISYFNDRCGSCHGNYGEFWGGGFAAELDDHELRDIVDEMAAGPAQAPLEGAALDVQVAYHRSLVNGRPFITAYLHEGSLRGEVTPGSRVALIIDGKEQPATVEKHTWRSNVAKATAVRATKGKETTELKLDATRGSAVAHSHAAKPSGE